MKTSLLFLSFLLFAITHQLSFAIREPVLDIRGEPLRPYAEYYIMPTIFGPTGGGVFPGKAGNSTHPVNVLKSFFEVDLGKPVKFRYSAEIDFIPVDTYMNIEFAQTPEGVSSGNWMVVKDLGEAWTVGIGFSIDHKGYQTLEGVFKINKHGLGYKLSFLPYVNGPMSGDIGTYIDDDRNWRLVVTDEQPYEVLFIKVEVESS
ncbi:hypothetical protein L6164_016622 [Bauhinia variegata]|uniref:Uncharacterized protein n=1 Tax=Bauhinia variegata TaxID=167791 RepID=A0ACB9NQ34_BAUVA|nr:hypothetical protein L6164_016622 [Bauhinia variegata]